MTTSPKASETTAITPFRVDIAQTDLDDLRERLARTRYADQLPSDGWAQGTPVAYLRMMVETFRILGFNDEEMQKMQSLNACRLLGVDPYPALPPKAA